MTRPYGPNDQPPGWAVREARDELGEVDEEVVLERAREIANEADEPVWRRVVVSAKFDRITEAEEGATPERLAALDRFVDAAEEVRAVEIVEEHGIEVDERVRRQAIQTLVLAGFDVGLDLPPDVPVEEIFGEEE